MSFEYCAGTEYGNPVGTNAALKDCLSLYGFNRMFSPILLLPGRENRPGLAFQGDERSGWYYIDIGVWGFSTFGFCSYILENSKLTMLTLSGKKLELVLPTLTSDQTQTYQDSSGTIPVKESLSWKDPVLAATIGNVTLSGPQTIDTVSLIAGDRVLVWQQTDPTENGIYIVATPWIRATDVNSSTRLNGAAVFVQSGDKNIGKIYGQTTINPVINTDDIVWVEISGSGGSSFGDFVYYDNNTTTDLDEVDLATMEGWLTLLDDTGHYVKIKTTGWQFERGDDPYIKGTSPLSSQISVTINTGTNKPKIKVGSSAARNICYKFESKEV